MTENKPWYDECYECENDTFRVRITPYGVCGSDTEWVCAKCGAEQGGIFNDPLNEIPPEIRGRPDKKDDIILSTKQRTEVRE